MNKLRKSRKNKKTSILFILIFMVTVSFFCVSTVTAAQWNVGEGQDYATIQEAIDNENTHDGDVINVFSGTYTEDVLVDKNLTIQANGSNVEIKSTKTGFTLVKGGNGSTIQGFQITSSGTGINISADNSNIQDNKITGGKTGILVSNSNTTILDNIISGQTENGVLGNLTGGFFTFSGNQISNIIGEGPVTGISITVNGSLTSFKAVENLISNIKGVSVFGIELGKSKGAGGNPEVANVENLIVTKNTITQIVANSAIMGIELVTSSTNALISENYLFKLEGLTNSTVYALEAAILGNGTVLVSENQVSQVTATDQAVGIVSIAMGNLKFEGNKVSNISKANAAVAMLGVGVFGSTSLLNNQVSNITSPTIAAGIVGTAMGHLDMLFNTASHVKGANEVYMVAVGFNSTTINGNNLEGDGTGYGIVICSPNGTINYNRIVNFNNYINNFMFSSFGPSIDQMLKPIDDAIKNHPELEPILKPIRDDLNKLFHSLENSNTTATYNWYGTNNPDSNKFFKGNGTLIYDPWLILNIKANPSTIHTGQTSTITADVYRDSAGGDHSANWAEFFSGPGVTFTTTLGNVGSKSIIVPWVNGLVTAILRGDDGAGIATVTATDYQTVQTYVTILGAPSNDTVPMQNTGAPVNYLLLAILMVIGGLLLPKRK